MKTAFRTLAGVVVGLVVSFALVIAVELFSEVVHPFPEGLEKSPEEICRHVERYPPWVLAVAVPAWAATAFAGTWTAGRLGNRIASATIGLLLLAALVCNVSMLPYPLWFKIIILLAVPAALVASSQMAIRGKGAGDGTSPRSDSPPVV